MIRFKTVLLTTFIVDVLLTLVHLIFYLLEEERYYYGEVGIIFGSFVMFIPFFMAISVYGLLI